MSLGVWSRQVMPEIGLEDRVTKGVYIWTSNGETLTAEQINDTFKEDEPKYKTGNEDYVEFQFPLIY